MKKWILGLMVMAVFAGSLYTWLEVNAKTDQKPAETTTAKTDSSSSESTKKLAGAILSLNSRLAKLEKSSGAEAKQEISRMRQELQSVRSEVNAMRDQVNQNSQSISTLHQRLTALDGKSGVIRTSR